MPRLDLQAKHANACNVLKKLALTTIDVFLLNDVRSQSGEDLEDGLFYTQITTDEKILLNNFKKYEKGGV